MDCYLCKDAGRKQVAHRILPGGRGVCKDHLSGMLDPGSVCAVSVVRPPAATAVAITEIKEETVPKKIEINSEKLKALHAQGLSDREIGERLGCSAATARVNRVALGLGPGAPGRRGHRASGKASKPGGGAARHRESLPRGQAGRLSSRHSRDTATIHLSAAALDRLWNDLALDVKAECIEKILGN